jgi:hypothetical protein
MGNVFGDGGDRLVHSLSGAPSDNHSGASSGQAIGDGKSNAGCRTGNDSGPVVKIDLHGNLLEAFDKFGLGTP